MDLLSKHLFEGDLPKNRTSESNILAANESLVIESLYKMREEALLEGQGNFMDDDLRETQHVFDKTPDYGRYSSSDSTDTDDNNRPIQWLLKRREVSSSKKGKENFVEFEYIRIHFTSSDSKKMMFDAMKASAESTADNRRKRICKVSRFQISWSDVVEVSGAKSEE